MCIFFCPLGVFANISFIGLNTYFLGFAIGINLFNSVVNMVSNFSGMAFFSWSVLVLRFICHKK